MEIIDPIEYLKACDDSQLFKIVNGIEQEIEQRLE